MDISVVGGRTALVHWGVAGMFVLRGGLNFFGFGVALDFTMEKGK